MSRSWREQVRISLAPHQVALVRLKRRVRTRLVDRKVLAIDGGADWSAAVDALREIFAHPNIGRRKFGRTEASVILSNHYVRYLVLPWSPRLVTPSEEAEFARMRFVQVFGETAKQWRIGLAPTPAGAGRVAAAVDQQLLDALDRSLSGSPFRLVSIQPALMSQFNGWRREIGDDGWLVIAERGRVLIAWIEKGEWRSIRARPLLGTPVPLAQWLAQERLLLEVPEAPSKVFLSVVDDVAIDTEGVAVQTPSPQARKGFAPRTDGGILLAMTGAI